MKKNNTIKAVTKSSWFWVIAAGYLLRIIVMPLTGQHDVMFMPWMTQFINQGHFNLYAYLYEQFGSIVMQRPGVWAPYPYGFYLLTAGWLETLNKLSLINLDNWASVWAVAYPARYVFLFKLLYLPFDLVIGYILYKVSGRIGAALWAWSPLAIYTPFMMGQNDIYATAFAVLASYSAAKTIQHTRQNQTSPSWIPEKHALLTAIFLGIGAIFKIYPLLLLPPLVLIIEKRWFQRLVLIGIGCSLLALFSLPFLTTPAYIEGVLFNPEGARLFREIQLFSTSISPFLLSYLILLIFLATTNPPLNEQPHFAWFVSLVVITMLFLWVPTMPHWLIWITPFLIAVALKSPKMSFAWILLQLSFVFVLITEHRELGVALPIHLASMFNVPNLPTALAITHPTLNRIFVTFLPVVNTTLIAVLLITAWTSIEKLIKKQSPLVDYYPEQRWWIGVPIVTFFLLLAVNLLFSRGLVSQNNWYTWEPLTVEGGDYVLQQLETDEQVTGVRLRLLSATPSTNLELCVYGDNPSEIALACVSKNVNEVVENQVLYFTFEMPIAFENGRFMIKLHPKNNNATITLPYAPSAKRALWFNEMEMDGMLDVSPLSSFRMTAAIHKLVVENVFQDLPLVVIIIITTMLIMLFFGGLDLSK